MALYAFDGTWNQERSAGEYGRNTNVVRFRDAYAGPDRFYTKGIGTRLGWFGKLIGGAFGAGGFGRLRRAHEDLCRQWLAGDHDIDIIGFSRGGALAVAFANRIHSRGIWQSDGTRVAERPLIRFMGLWDVVAAFGIPFDIGPFEFGSINLGYKLTLPDNVGHAFHALALDERRRVFRPTRIKGAYEVWFRGSHSDVGGGNGNERLNAISLAWMLSKAQLVGLPIAAGAIEAARAAADPSAPIQPAESDNRRDPWRELIAGDVRHYSVQPCAGCAPEIPTAVESRVDEALAATLERRTHA